MTHARVTLSHNGMLFCFPISAKPSLPFTSGKSSEEILGSVLGGGELLSRTPIFRNNSTFALCSIKKNILLRVFQFVYSTKENWKLNKTNVTLCSN